VTKDEAFAAYLRKPKGRSSFDFFCAGWEYSIDNPVAPTKDDIPFQEIIDILNRITGKAFKPTPTHRSYIRARWVEGSREKDFERVVLTKHDQWKDDKAMAIFLRPETLFGTKMDGYLNEPEARKKKIIRNHMGQEVEVDCV
jgi:uncharacterized phage protein (TIGR02220 family)